MHKNTNPLSATVPLRSVAAATPPAASRVRSRREVQLAEEMPAFSIVGKYLVKILTEEIRLMTHPDISRSMRTRIKLVMLCARRLSDMHIKIRSLNLQEVQRRSSTGSSSVRIRVQRFLWRVLYVLCATSMNALC